MDDKLFGVTIHGRGLTYKLYFFSRSAYSLICDIESLAVEFRDDTICTIHATPVYNETYSVTLKGNDSKYHVNVDADDAVEAVLRIAQAVGVSADLRVEEFFVYRIKEG